MFNLKKNEIYLCLQFEVKRNNTTKIEDNRLETIA